MTTYKGEMERHAEIMGVLGKVQGDLGKVQGEQSGLKDLFGETRADLHREMNAIHAQIQALDNASNARMDRMETTIGNKFDRFEKQVERDMGKLRESTSNEMGKLGDRVTRLEQADKKMSRQVGKNTLLLTGAGTVTAAAITAALKGWFS
uniref:Apolipoprotein A1/A4/E domain-containing protein n=1 Tax=Candidatus Kentrum sp. UNK TaxID=2126344 RepID=A0A451AMI3_9GAMM|nr:MAG: hypothetical protein BECKUNK1418G_GA0071005_11328 [Candidatus Kentron sp. UNK]VFK72593.1 MAG: hypothetical protein BECKUNK1418H_GA0071006_11248 [Candidatus Kentron sp. UNK]